jgi:hypothetical protein
VGVDRDAAGTVRLLVDGVVVDTETCAGTIAIDDGRIGDERFSALGKLNGLIADPLIFDRALSLAEWRLLADPSFHLACPRWGRLFASPAAFDVTVDWTARLQLGDWSAEAALGEWTAGEARGDWTI